MRQKINSRKRNDEMRKGVEGTDTKIREHLKCENNVEVKRKLPRREKCQDNKKMLEWDKNVKVRKRPRNKKEELEMLRRKKDESLQPRRPEGGGGGVKEHASCPLPPSLTLTHSSPMHGRASIVFLWSNGQFWRRLILTLGFKVYIFRITRNDTFALWAKRTSSGYTWMDGDVVHHNDRLLHVC